MKTIKSILLVVTIFCFTYQISAQQMFLIHQDNVKPSKAMEYETIAKEFNDASIAHNVQTQWIAAVRDDFTYYYIKILWYCRFVSDISSP